MTETIDPQPTLYIIIRSDIQDMNPGKAIAQGSHATSDFHNWAADTSAAVVKNFSAKSPPNDAHVKLCKQLCQSISNWQEDRSFGRVLTVEATFEQMQQIIEAPGVHGEMTLDPTYPWRNHYGETFLSPEITCGWVFDMGHHDNAALKSLPLHR